MLTTAPPPISFVTRGIVTRKRKSPGAGPGLGGGLLAIG